MACLSHPHFPPAFTSALVSLTLAGILTRYAALFFFFFFFFFYNGSCVYTHCSSEYLAWASCNSASGLLSSLFLVTMMALVVSFLSQKF